MKTRIALVATVLAASAHAQSIKPGLWEHAFTIKSGSGQMEGAMAEMQKQMAAMPPEQRKMMEQMMAQQGVGMGPKGQSVKICITPEEAARQEVPAAEGNCTQKVTQRSGSTIKMTFSCADQPPSSGEGEITFLSPTAYSGKAVVRTTVEGKPERVDMTTTGKWLSANCGAIKPAKR
jgi:hypothetical protein